MEKSKSYPEIFAPKELFEDMIGNPIMSFLLGYKSNNPELKMSAMKILRENIDEFKRDPTYLRMDYFAQAVSDIESAIVTCADEGELVDKLKKVWDDFREKTKKAGVV